MEEPPRQIQTIEVETALVLSKEAIRTAFEGRVSGVAMVFGSDGLLLAAQAVGSKGTPAGVDMAMLEIKTVLSTRRSVGRWGFAIYDKPPEEGGEFVGAVAFSGDDYGQNWKVCVEAIKAAGLCGDGGRFL